MINPMDLYIRFSFALLVLISAAADPIR